MCSSYLRSACHFGIVSWCLVGGEMKVKEVFIEEIVGTTHQAIRSDKIQACVPSLTLIPSVSLPFSYTVIHDQNVQREEFPTQNCG